MAQSIYSDEKYKIFDKYTKRLRKEMDTYDKEKREKNIQNWLKGRKLMEQLALKYGMEFNQPYPMFARKDEIDKIVWVKSTITNIETIWGIWAGEDHVKIEYKGQLRHVFNEGYLDFLAHGCKDKEKVKKTMALLMIRFDGVEIR